MSDTASGLLGDTAWHGGFYSGGWKAAGNAQDVIEPASGRKLGRVGVATPDDIARAAIAAHEAQADWANQPYDTRARILRSAAAQLEGQAGELADWIVRETGSIRPKADFEIGITVRCLHEAAAMPSQAQGQVLPGTPDRISLCRRVPLGVVGVISPFNFPLYLAMRAVAPALAVGNAVVLKPDLRTAVSGGVSIARLFERAGLPRNVLHVLPAAADAGAALCSDDNVAMIQFTGSTPAGRKVGELASRHLKKVSLELGGKNTLIVLDDADLDLAASNAAWASYLHQGQICMSAGRILVQQKIAGAFADKLATRARHLPVGDPSTAQVALGPLINAQQRDHAHDIVQRSAAAGARVEAGGSYEGLYYQPTVLSGVQPGMPAFEEEVFGPVAALTSFDSDDEAVALASRTAYGLSAGVISASLQRALAIGNRLRVGLLHINDQTVADDVLNPFGGRGISGNGTSIGGPANWEEFTQWQWVTIKGSATPYPF
ncbi:MAG: benzaldehyde dehydrogenase [Proteobacteria bacterium]|nr:benzaldehyde dehydrogenase [Pseudomonadota bacterium]